jgi:hypothetical protein
MEQASHYVFTNTDFANRTAALGNSLAYIGQRVLGIVALLAFTYGLLAAEVKLAQLEQVTTLAAR